MEIAPEIRALFHGQKCIDTLAADLGNEDVLAMALADADQLALWRSLGHCPGCTLPLPPRIPEPAVFIFALPSTPATYYGFGCLPVEERGPYLIVACPPEHERWRTNRLASGLYLVRIAGSDEPAPTLEEARALIDSEYGPNQPVRSLL